MIVGCTLLGYVTDAFGGTRSPGFFVSYIFGALPLLFLPALQRSIPHYAVAFGIIGVFTGGPAHMYGTAVSVDLGVAGAVQPGAARHRRVIQPVGRPAARRARPALRLAVESG